MRQLSIGLVVLGCLSLGGLGLGVETAEAQDRRQEALDLSRQGMAQYNNLEVEEARATLLRALEVAREAGLSGEALARIYTNLGVVLVGGMQDNAGGMDAFSNAVREYPDIRLDPLTATPEITTVFTMARRRTSREPDSSDSDTDTDTDTDTDSGSTPPPDNGGPPAASAGDLPAIPHDAILEQLEGTALPVFVDVPAEAPVEELVVYYRSEGASEYQSISMARMADGFGTELPCTAVIQPRVEYYLVAFAAGREPLGAAGSADEPLVVPIVSARTLPAAALPGADPPPDGVCGGGDAAAPVPAAEGEEPLSCESDIECPIDYICEGGLCQLVPPDPEAVPDTPFANAEEAPRFFVEVQGFWGSAFAGSGLPADSGPPESDPNNIAWVPESGSPEAIARGTPETDCDNNGDDRGRLLCSPRKLRDRSDVRLEIHRGVLSVAAVGACAFCPLATQRGRRNFPLGCCWGGVFSTSSPCRTQLGFTSRDSLAPVAVRSNPNHPKTGLRKNLLSGVG